jgi:signal transduction histidine kinase
MKQKNTKMFYKINSAVIIYSDPRRLKQILYNLISNAVKFTDNGVITITTEENQDEYLFSVKDTGIGIKEDEKELIFDLFRKGSTDNDAKKPGIGLGLSICEKLIHNLKGDIFVKSKIGEGSEFIFTLPKANKLKAI